MNRNMEKRILQIYGRCPIPRANGVTHVFYRLHPEVRGLKMICVGVPEVQDGPHPTGLFGDQKEIADIAGRWGEEGDLFYGLL